MMAMASWISTPAVSLRQRSVNGRLRLWTLYSSTDPADRTGLPCTGGNHSTGTSPSIPPSDDYLPDLKWSIGCTDPTNLRPRKQKEPGNLSTPLTGSRRTGVSRGSASNGHPSWSSGLATRESFLGRPHETDAGFLDGDLVGVRATARGDQELLSA
jgi:hypothetical protein